MLQIREDGSFTEANDLRTQVEPPGIKSVKQDKDLKTEIKEMTEQYTVMYLRVSGRSEVYIKNGKEQCEVQHEIRSIARSSKTNTSGLLPARLKKWFGQCVEEEIFEEVPEGEAVTWCFPLVVQPKPKFNTVDKEKLEPHMIGASVDLRVANQFMERNRITHGPIVKYFMYKFHHCTVFSKHDMRRGTTNSYSIQSPGRSL